MPFVDRRVEGKSTPLRLAPKVFMALLFGLVFAVLAFSQAAASTGLKFETFRPLGGSFFSWRRAQYDLAIDLFAKRQQVDAGQLILSGRTGLSYAPLSAQSMWLIGKGFEAREDLKAARQIMARAQMVTRRDAAVQLWLAEDAFRRSLISDGLAHYDLIIRSEPETSKEILPRLAMVMVAPEGRRYLRPYIRNDNPWLSPFLTTAVNILPKAEPLGRLLLERGKKAPYLDELDSTYAKLVTRLVDEGAEDIALRVYPLLPNGDKTALASIGGTVDGKLVKGYPPFIWSLANDAFGATLVNIGANSNGMEIYSAPGTIGVAASKLVAPRAASQLLWRVHDRSINLQSSATWVATCLAGTARGDRLTSINLLSQAVPLNKSLVMRLPKGCEVVRIDMRIAGGIGANSASLIVGDLRLIHAAAD